MKSTFLFLCPSDNKQRERHSLLCQVIYHVTPWDRGQITDYITCSFKCSSSTVRSSVDLIRPPKSLWHK